MKQGFIILNIVPGKCPFPLWVRLPVGIKGFRAELSHLLHPDSLL